MKRFLSFLFIIFFIFIITLPAFAKTTTIWECTFDNDSDWTTTDEGEHPTGFVCYLYPQLSRSLTGGKDGTGGFRICSNESNAPYANCAYMAITAGATYRFSADVYTEAIGNYGYYFYIQYRDKLINDNVTPQIGNYGTVGTNGLYDEDIGVGEWKTFSCTWTAPHDANFIRFGPKAAGGTIIIVDNMKLELVESEDVTVTTPEPSPESTPKSAPENPSITSPQTEANDVSEKNIFLKEQYIFLYFVLTMIIIISLIFLLLKKIKAKNKNRS